MKYYLHHEENRYILGDEEKSPWLYLVLPGPDEISEISRHYHIPEKVLASVADPSEVPRSESEFSEDFDLFILRYPVESKKGVYETRPMAFIGTKEVIITIKYDEDDAFTTFLTGEGHRLIEDERLPKERLFVDLAYHICKSYIDYTKVINRRIEDLEEAIAQSTKSETIRELISISRSLIRFTMATEDNEPVLNSLFHLEGLADAPERDRLLNDLKIESTQARLMAKEASITVEKLSDLYSSLVSNNLNDVMKTLTSITILLTIPTIIGGFWGMNTALPMAKHPMAFWWLVALTVFISIGLYLYLKKKDYL